MKIYNTLAKKKEELIVRNNTTKIYACGPTVYNFIHIGNARPLCVFDVFRRYLKHKGYNVVFVQNFTDIDDKIINKANENHISFSEISEKYIKEFETDAHGLNVLDADIRPRATETISEIIEMVQILVNKGFAYKAYNRDVYFNSLKFSEYGKLSGQPIDELMECARVDKNDNKRHPLDFVLWKSSKEGEPFWESPWGKGRPGWHIECSCMIKKYLGNTIDIHCGGQDLIFPHHENEIAQSECANGCSLSRYWMHNGFINIDNKKMSKSLNNFFTVREISEKYGYMPIRYLMISSHYRSPLNFSIQSIEGCKNSIERLINFKKNLNSIKSKSSEKNLDSLIDLGKISYDFDKFMDDDLNTSGALSVIFDMVKNINIKISVDDKFEEESVNKVLKLFSSLVEILGISLDVNEAKITNEISKLIEKRNEYRKNKDWKNADLIRDQLIKLGINISDSSFNK